MATVIPRAQPATSTTWWGRLSETQDPSGDRVVVDRFDALGRALVIQAGHLASVVEVARYFYDDPDNDTTAEHGVVQRSSEPCSDIHGDRDTTDQSLLRLARPIDASESSREAERSVRSRQPWTCDGAAGGQEQFRVAEHERHRGQDDLLVQPSAGTVYKAGVFVDPENEGSGQLAVHTWFDPVGRPVAVWGPNAPAVKIEYDGLGRRTRLSRSDRKGDPGPGNR